MNDGFFMEEQTSEPTIKDQSYGLKERVKPLKCTCGDPYDSCPIHEDGWKEE